MPIIKDIQLLVPADKDQNRLFFNQTRSISFLYSRLLPKLHAKDDRGIQINCVENLEKVKQLDPYDYIIFNYFPVFVEVDVQGFLELSDRKKKVKTLEIVHEGMKLAACEFNWDTSLLDEVYEKVKQLDYQNIYPLIKKSSPNKKYVGSILCHHEVSTIDVYMEIKKRNGKVVGKDKIFSVENTDEQDLFSEYWILVWKLNNKLEFADDRFNNVYRLTFLEKDEPDQLVWKIKKLTVN